jgi:hypothetical protein
MNTTNPAVLEKCPKCTRLVTSIYQSGDKKFYNHGEGGTVNWKSRQTFDLKFDDYCTVEIGTEPKAKSASATIIDTETGKPRNVKSGDFI